MKARGYASTTRHSGSAELERERYQDPTGTGDSFIYLHHDDGVSDQTFFFVLGNCKVGGYGVFGEMQL